jgi:hypothetical protein
MDFYEDISRRGGLVASLQSTLDGLGFAMSVETYTFLSAFSDLSRLPEYARVGQGKRVCQLFMHAQKREFLFDLWERGHCLGNGETATLLAAGRAIGSWLATDISMSRLSAEFPYVTATREMSSYEVGKEVEFAWQSIVAAHPELGPIVTLAAAHPVLGKLFPYTSLDRLCFSRCTGYPYTGDCPIVLPPNSGVYIVTDSFGNVHGTGTVANAIAIVLAHLPAGIGPAIRGTARDLGGTSDS